MNVDVEQIKLKIRAADPALGGQEMLSAAEHVRLASMHGAARPSFVTARTMLRQELGEYMGLVGSAVPLVQEGAGRVFLDGYGDNEPPFFSVSHSGVAEAGIAAIAVAETTPIGIDIQQTGHHIDWKRVAQRRFPAREWDMLKAMPESEGRMLFFTLWSIKEACVKMENGTLMPYLRGIEIDFRDGRFKLASPTPRGLTDTSIFYHFVSEFDLAVACVSQHETIVKLDCHIARPVAGPSSLDNTGFN